MSRKGHYSTTKRFSGDSAKLYRLPTWLKCSGFKHSKFLPQCVRLQKLTILLMTTLWKLHLDMFIKKGKLLKVL